MDGHYRRWGILVAIIFSLLCIPMVLINTFVILFSYMGSPFPWESYLTLGPLIILAILIALISIRSIFSANLRLFIMMESVLVSMIAILIIIFSFYYPYSFYALCYSLSGILQIRKFWRFASPAITKRHLKPALVIMVIASLISCASLGYSMVRAIPKLAPDKKGIKFVIGSVQFHDDWNKKLFFGLLAEEQEIQGILFSKDTWVYFYESGKLQMAKLGGKDLTIQRIPCAGNKDVYFYESGKLQGACLSEDQEIGGKMYYKGESLHFNEDGSVEKSYRED